MDKREIVNKLKMSLEHENVKVGRNQIFKEDGLYVVEKFEYVEDGEDMFSVVDAYKDVEEAVDVAMRVK